MPDKALNVFEQMSVDPNNVIHRLVFVACAKLANERAVNLGKKLLRQILPTSTNDHTAFDSAIHMLMRFGEMKRAEDLFKSVKNKDISIYTAMMKAYNLNKQPLKSLELFDEMKQQHLIPDEMTFISLMNACSQLGIRTICQSLAAQIPSHFYVKQSISNALIDMWACIDCHRFQDGCLPFLG